MKDHDDFLRIRGVGTIPLKLEELRHLLKQNGFCVRSLAMHLGVEIRTFERHFSEHHAMTPKRWMMVERMTAAPPLLAAGLSNKEVAARLVYTCQSNFCRDFKRHFGCTPKEFARIKRHILSRVEPVPQDG